MEATDYQKLVLRTSDLKPSLAKGVRVIAYVSLWTVLSAYLSFSENTWIWLSGQVLYGLVVLQWFVLLHDFGHNHFFKSGRLNWLFGYVSSLFCLVPYAPWKWIHSQHHTWTGWHDLDPTQESTLPNQAKPLKNKIANICWLLGIPVLTLAFSFKNFWNLPRLFRLFPDTTKHIHFVFSIFLLIAVFAAQVYFVPGFLAAWIVGYCFFLFLSDPLLISQHVHIPQKISHGATVNPFSVKEQDQYTRTLIFPTWVSKYILLGFDKHTLHHIIPRLPCYHLNSVDYTFSGSIPWHKWLVIAKQTPAETLLFSNNNNTGLNI